MNIQTNEAVTADICVTNIAMPAPPLAPRAEPALKPNHLIYNIEDPIIVNIGLCSGVIDFGKPLFLPCVKAVIKAAVTAVACTTMPLAKSIVPQDDKIPTPQTQCVTGTYTIKTQRFKKISIAEDLILSANALIIRAGVIIANVI